MPVTKETQEDIYSQYIGKKIVVSLKDKEDPLEGKVLSASAIGILIKVPRSSTPALIMASDIETDGIEVLPEKPSSLRQRAMDEVSEGKVRRHLLDCHGFQLDTINEWSEDDALAEHDSIEHDGLGHHHDGKKKSDGTDTDSESTDED